MYTYSCAPDTDIWTDTHACLPRNIYTYMHRTYTFLSRNIYRTLELSISIILGFCISRYAEFPYIWKYRDLNVLEMW